MGEIFSRARLVAACIGECDDDFLNVLSLSRMKDQHGVFDIFRAQENIRKARQLLDGREYFHRLWIVQECSFAKDLLIFCGPFTLPHSQWVERLCSDDWHEDGHIPRASRETLPGLTYSIVHFSHRMCSDLHDKIYGFLALAHPGRRARLHLDYSQPLWHTLSDFSTAMTVGIADVKIPRILYYAVRKCSQSNSPRTLLLQRMDDDSFSKECKIPLL